MVRCACRRRRANDGAVAAADRARLRVSNVYDINPANIPPGKAEAKLMLLIEWDRVHTTEFMRDKGTTPSVFTVGSPALKQAHQKVEQLGSRAIPAYVERGVGRDHRAVR